MIDRDIILDLIPLYRAGLGSPATRALVEAYLIDHPDIALPGDDAGEADWRASLIRARGLARWRRRLFGLAIALSVVCLALDIRRVEGQPPSIHLLALQMPELFAPLTLAALLAWLAYWRVSVRAGTR